MEVQVRDIWPQHWGSTFQGGLGHLLVLQFKMCPLDTEQREQEPQWFQFVAV